MIPFTRDAGQPEVVYFEKECNNGYLKKMTEVTEIPGRQAGRTTRLRHNLTEDFKDSGDNSITGSFHGARKITWLLKCWSNKHEKIPSIHIKSQHSCLPWILAAVIHLDLKRIKQKASCNKRVQTGRHLKPALTQKMCL